MRFALISDSHTRSNIESLISYLKKLVLKVKFDAIVINGDLLGENEHKPGYGYRFTKSEMESTLDKDKVLQSVAPTSYNDIKEIISIYKQGRLVDDESLNKLGNAVCSYIQDRYNFIIETLAKFSVIKKTFYNLGDYESPLHYKVLKELAFLLDVEESFLRKAVLYTPYRDIYKNFKNSLQELESPRFHYIGGRPIIESGIIFAGIPGLNPSSVPTDSSSELQEKITREQIDSIKRKFSYAKKLVIFNHAKGRITKEPFTFRPGSPAIRELIQELKGKLSQKVFIQSHYHFPTTHFYKRDEFLFILNNAAVNNKIFNIIEMSGKVRCFDADPNISKLREVKPYDSYIAEYNTPEERLALNYQKPEEIIEQRQIKGCYYM